MFCSAVSDRLRRRLPMDFETTPGSRAVHHVAPPSCGDVLIVDDDRAFAGFMVTALQSRGHDVDWAGSVADGLASLFARRYDLVLIDLRLSDGSGLQLLRDATDERLLAQSAAVILTGHDDEAPSDIRMFRKGFELDPFLDRIGDIVAATRRHRRLTATRLPAALCAVAFDRQRRAEAGKNEVILYTPGGAEARSRALSAEHPALPPDKKAPGRLAGGGLGG